VGDRVAEQALAAQDGEGAERARDDPDRPGAERDDPQRVVAEEVPALTGPRLETKP